MAQETKPIVLQEETFEKLEIRVGKVLNVEDEPLAPKKSYKLKIDFGKFGIKTSIGRFTMHTPEEIQGKLVLGVLNLGNKALGEVVSEVLILGVQYPKADSGEATFITPLNPNVKIGSKLF